MLIDEAYHHFVDSPGLRVVKALNEQIREDAIAKLRALGYEVLPSEANFFMVGRAGENGRGTVRERLMRFALVLVYRWRIPSASTASRNSRGDSDPLLH